MNSNIFMALSTTALNAAAAVLIPVLGKPEAAQVLQAVFGLVSPFLSIYLLKLYIKADDPPDLIRQVSALEHSISICKNHLKDKNATPEFKQRTRKQMEDFQTKLQNARAIFEAGRSHTVTPISAADD